MLMKKMEAYAAEHGIDDFHIDAVGIGKCKEVWQNYDCILLAPQVGFNKAQVTRYVEIPVEAMAPLDYGRQNCEAIFKQIEGMLGQGRPIDNRARCAIATS